MGMDASKQEDELAQTLGVHCFWMAISELRQVKISRSSDINGRLWQEGARRARSIAQRAEVCSTKEKRYSLTKRKEFWRNN